jgi:hypothetical protein
MQILFSAEFSQNKNSQSFTIYQLSDNLFQAKSPTEIITLWKNKKVWEGVTNLEESDLIEQIGRSIDTYTTANEI